LDRLRGWLVSTNNEFVSTNNEAEYESVLLALMMAREMGIMNLEIRSDSRFVVEQVNGNFVIQEGRMSQYLEKVHRNYCNFDRVILTKIPREENSVADALSRIGSGIDLVALDGDYKVLFKSHPSVFLTAEVLQVDELEPEWGVEVIRYLKTGELPSIKEEAWKVVRHSARYVLIDGILYRRGYSLPLLKWLSRVDADYVLREVHEGVCGNHSGGKMLVNKVIRAGYYWSTMSKDATDLVRTCDV